MKQFIRVSLFLSFAVFATVSAGSQAFLDLKHWDFDAIQASHVIYSKTKPRADCLLDLETIKWFVKQLGDSIFSSDGCFVYTSLSDGWVSKKDTQSRKTLAKIRVGLKIANATLSKDGRILLVGNQQPADLVLLNTKDLSVARMIPVKNRKGELSPVAKVRTASDEQGFIVAPKNFSKIWKINYQNPAPIGFGDGWNHDYRCMKEHVNKTLFPIKRLKIGQSLDDFYVDEKGIFLVGRDKSGKGMIMDLDLSRVVDRPNIPDIGQDLLWEMDGTHYLAFLDDKGVNIFTHKNKARHWKEAKRIEIDSPLVISACPDRSALWVSSKNGKIYLIDKQGLEKLNTLSLEANAAAMQMRCLSNSRGMLLKNKQGDIAIYDSKTFQKIN